MRPREITAQGATARPGVLATQGPDLAAYGAQIAEMRQKLDGYAGSPAQPVKAGVAAPGTSYSRARIIYRDVVYGTGEHREKTIDRAGTWGGETDPATDVLGRDLYPRPDVHGFLPVRAVLVSDSPDGSAVEYSVPFDEKSREEIAQRAHARRVENANRAAEAKAHSFPAEELRKSMKVRLSDGRAVTIERISVPAFSHHWAISGIDEGGNETSGYIDSRQPVHVFNRTRG